MQGRNMFDVHVKKILDSDLLTTLQNSKGNSFFNFLLDYQIPFNTKPPSHHHYYPISMKKSQSMVLDRRKVIKCSAATPYVMETSPSLVTMIPLKGHMYMSRFM